MADKEEGEWGSSEDEMGGREGDRGEEIEEGQMIDTEGSEDDIDELRHQERWVPARSMLEVQTGWHEKDGMGSRHAKSNVQHSFLEPSKTAGTSLAKKAQVDDPVTRPAKGKMGHRMAQSTFQPGELMTDVSEVWGEMLVQKEKEWDEKFQTQWVAHERELTVMKTKRLSVNKMLEEVVAKAKATVERASETTRENVEDVQVRVTDDAEGISSDNESTGGETSEQHQGKGSSEKKDGKKRGKKDKRKKGDKEKQAGDKKNKKKLPYMGTRQPLGGHLSKKIKKRIANGKYVEIFKLLHRPVMAKEGSKEEEKELARRPHVAETIENWASAFSIYAAIYLEKHPEQGPALFKYMDLVRSAHANFGGTAWLRYDDEFRVRKAVEEGLEWDKLDQDLWITIMTPTRPLAHSHTASGHSVPFQTFRGRPTHSGVGFRSGRSGFGQMGSGRGTGAPAGPCWNYNRGSCTRQNCWFDHKCKHCGGSHPVIQCYGTGRGSGGEVSHGRRAGRGFSGKGGYSN